MAEAGENLQKEPSNDVYTLLQAIKDTNELRKTLQNYLSNNKNRMRQLNMENQQLRIDKKGLIDYIRELEKFTVDKIDVKELKKIVERRVEP